MSIKETLKSKFSVGVKKYTLNTLWMLFEKSLRIIAEIFVGIWVARYLSPENYGILNFSLSYVFVFSAVASLGLDRIIVRELVRDEKRRDVILGTSFTLKIIGAIILLLLLVISLFIFQIDNTTSVFILIIGISFIFKSFNIIESYFQAKVLAKYPAWSNTIMLFFSSLLKIILILFKAPLIAFVIVVLLESIVLALFYLVFYKRRKLKVTLWKVDRTEAKRLLLISWPLMLSGVVVAILMRIDQLMIEWLMGSYNYVGQYAAAVRLSEGWSFISVVIITSLFPAIINAKKNNSEIYNQRMQRLYDLLVWLAVLIAIPSTIFADIIFRYLYGVAYLGSAIVLKIHVWSAVFGFIGVAYTQWLIVEGFTKKALYRSLFGVITNIILNILMIPKFGIKGAAIATLISQIAANIGYDFFDPDVRVALKQKVKALFFINTIKKIIG